MCPHQGIRPGAHPGHLRRVRQVVASLVDAAPGAAFRASAGSRTSQSRGRLVVVGEAAAIAIGGTVGLDAMFGGPITGASMNPARSLGPAIVTGDLHAIWIYLLAPVAGAALAALTYTFIRGEPIADSPGQPQ
jgi:hypothetical protein